MSLIPFILDLADELHEFSRCLANGIDINDFGFGLYTGADQQQHQQQQQQQQQQPQNSPRRSRTSSFSSFWMPSKRHHPYNRIKTACCAKSGEEAVANPEKLDASSSSSIGGTPGKSASYSVVNKNGFQVSMNVKQFAPNELSVKTIDNCIVVEGRHDDKEDGHGVISRHFVRKYMLPKGYDPNDVLSTLSSDGILTVKAPPPAPSAKNDEPNERFIEIQPTPGPTPVLVVSAKDTPAKETTKKLATIPLTRSECQLPEAKRQKLDLPPEPQPEEPTPIPPATATENESNFPISPATEAALVSNDVEMEKADEQISEEIVEEQKTSDAAEIENDVEKKSEINEQTEKLLEKEQEEQQKSGQKILDETENKLLDECMSESNGDSKNNCEKMEEEECSIANAAEVTEEINDTPTETKIKENIKATTKMDVDGEDEDDDENMDNTENVVATIKTADNETKATTKAAVSDDVSAKNTDTKTSSSNTTTTNTNNNNKSSTNKSSNSSRTTTTTISNSSPEVVTKDVVNDVKGGNGVVTGKIPVDIPNSDDSDADTTTTNNIKGLADDKAESVTDKETETAVLCINTTTGNIDDVALLKAAKVGPTAITDNTDGNVILTESIDGITTADLSTTDTTTVDSSLFVKNKTHLGNGNNATATPIVGTEEMAN